MRWLSIGLAVVVGWVFLEALGAHQEPMLVPEEEQERVRDVFRRHADKLRENPDVLGLLPSPGTGEIVIITDRPLGMPTTIEGVPVKIKLPPPHLPPPPGVIVLKPGGTYEHLPNADQCPPRHKEVREYRWRFCDPEEDPQPLPALMAPPIAGIPFKEAEAIYNRHLDELLTLPGVKGTGLAADGVVVETERPELVPPQLEGLPVKAVPPTEVHLTNHTDTLSINPFHGGTSVADPLASAPRSVVGGAYPTGAGIVLAGGKPWFVAPAHAVNQCDEPPDCGAASGSLTTCPHYYSPGRKQSFLKRSPAQNPEQIAWVSRRDILSSAISNAVDAAAGFLDNDTTEGNGSLSVNRSLHESPFQFSGMEANGARDQDVYIVSATSSSLYPGPTGNPVPFTAPHENTGTIAMTNVTGRHEPPVAPGLHQHSSHSKIFFSTQRIM